AGAPLGSASIANRIARVAMRNRRGLGRRVWLLAKPGVDAVLGRLVGFILRAARHLDRLWISDVIAGFMRPVGPWTTHHRLGRANLAAAFPEKTPAEIERILAGVWDNLGRVVGEFAHLDRLLAGDPHHLPYFELDPAGVERFNRLRDAGK